MYTYTHTYMCIYTYICTVRKRLGKSGDAIEFVKNNSNHSRNHSADIHNSARRLGPPIVTLALLHVPAALLIEQQAQAVGHRLPHEAQVRAAALQSG